MEDQPRCAYVSCRALLERPLRRCSRCKGPQYCSRECQKSHWPDHKSECDLIKHLKRSGVIPADSVRVPQSGPSRISDDLTSQEQRIMDMLTTHDESDTGREKALDLLLKTAVSKLPQRSSEEQAVLKPLFDRLSGMSPEELAAILL